MDLTALLQACDTSTHSQRVRKMIDLGKQTGEIPEVNSLVNELASGSVYEQFLALQTYYGSHNIKTPQQALKSTSKLLRLQALRLISKLGTDDDLFDALISVPAYLQTKTLRQLRDSRPSRKRLHVIDRFLLDLQSKGEDPALFQDLFLLGTENLIEKYLPESIDGFSLKDWGLLAKNHPKVANRELKIWIGRAELNDHLLLETVKYVFGQWIGHNYCVDYALELVRTVVVSGKISLLQVPHKELAEKRPTEVVDIYLSHEPRLTKDDIGGLEYILVKVDMERFKRIYEKYPFVVNYYNFQILRQEQCIFVYEHIKIGWRDRDGQLDQDVIRQLPLEGRIAEARRNLKLRFLESLPNEKIWYISLLPWDEATELQKPFFNSSEPAIRIKAFSTQIGTAGYDEATITKALKLIIERKNEQDPVRTAILGALAQIPKRRFKESHLEDLSQIIRDTLDVSGVSSMTIIDLVRIPAALISTFPKWASKHIAMIFKERECESFYLCFSDPKAEKEGTIAMAEEMSPVIKKYLRKREPRSLRFLGRAFLGKIRYWPELLDAYEEMLTMPESEPLEEDLSALIKILKKNRPQTWGHIIPAMWERKKLGVTSEKMVDEVHRRQQNLLDLYLDVEGSETRLNPFIQIHSGFWRWTPAQQDKLVGILKEEINNEDTAQMDRVRDIRQLGRLSFSSPEFLIQLSTDEKTLTYETSLHALAAHDSSTTVPVILTALNDHRARTAIYTLHHHLKYLSKSDALTLLLSLPQERITISKEILRLLGSLRTTSAFEHLLQKSKEDLHTDIRLALLHALQPYYNKPETWTILEASASSPDTDIIKALSEIKSTGLSPTSQLNLLHLLLKILNHPTPSVRLAALIRLGDNPLNDPTDVLGPRLQVFVFSKYRREYEASITVLFKSYTTPSYIPKLIAIYKDLIKTNQREILRRWDSEFLFNVGILYYRDSVKGLIEPMLELLKEDRLGIKKRVDIIFRGLEWKEIKIKLREMIGELHPDALASVEDYIENDSRGSLDFESILSTEDGRKTLRVDELEFSNMADERGRRIGLSLLLAGVDTNRGWTDEERERLRFYRNDESVMVAEKAWDTNWYVGEKDEGDKDADEL